MCMAQTNLSVGILTIANKPSLSIKDTAHKLHVDVAESRRWSLGENSKIPKWDSSNRNYNCGHQFKNTSSYSRSHLIMYSCFVFLFRDFAFVARDPNTSRHKCHMFRCHGNISGRAITGALHEMCSKILEEKKRAQEVVKTKSTQQKPWSDILNTPPPPSVRGM